MTTGNIMMERDVSNEQTYSRRLEFVITVLGDGSGKKVKETVYRHRNYGGRAT